MSLKNLKKLILIISSFSIIACSQGQGGSGSKTSSDSLAYLKGGEGEWVLKVDDFTINQTNFNKDFRTTLMNEPSVPKDKVELAFNDAQTKQIYAEQLINSILLINKAEEEKIFESEEAKEYINLAIRNIKMQYYITKLAEEELKNIPELTPEQLKAIFEQGKEQFVQYGITEYNAETAPYISQVYKDSYIQQIMARKIQDLKDKAVIERNTAVLGEASILPPQIGDTNATAIPQGTNNPAALPQQGDNLLPRTNN